MPEVVQGAWVPCPGWLLVRPVETDEWHGSLVIPDSVRDGMTRTQYEVIASGGPAPVDDEDPETPHVFHPGDWILAPQRVAFGVVEEDLVLLSERQVWGVISAA